MSDLHTTTPDSPAAAPPLDPSGAPLGTLPAGALPDAVPPVPTKPVGPRFAELGLRDEVLRALEAMGFQHAMDVQAATIPLVRQRRDLMVQSRTGSGKTAAFGIPFVNDVVDPEVKAVQALVLLPTRELALQVASELARIAAQLPITVAPIYGGAPMGRQVEQLRGGAQIVCGTPGRVLDHLRRGSLKLDQVRCAVLDECDEMLSMGFQEDIENILDQTPTTRQTLLFSATVPEGIQRLSRRFLKNPEFLKLSADFVGVHEIRHVYYSIPGINREQELLRILNFEDPKTAILFCNTREETGRVAEFLRKQGYNAEAISSDLGQSDREKVMADTRAGKVRFLVATDVAARGIDIEGLSHVFNYTFPDAPEIYIHRTGRTGRAGKHGTAISLIGPTEVGSFYYLKLLYKIKPEERALPSEAEIRSHREGERILQLRQLLAAAGEPTSEWKSLARRLIGAVDAEALVAALLIKSFAAIEGMPAVPLPKPAPKLASASPSPSASTSTSTTSSGHGGFAGRSAEGRDERPRNDSGPRGEMRSDRGGGPRDRDRPLRRDRSGRPGDRSDDSMRRGARPGAGPERDRGRDTAPRRTRPEEQPRPAGETGAPAGRGPGEKEFWEVWGEEQAQRRSGEGAPGPEMDGGAPQVVSPAHAPAPGPSVSDAPMFAYAGGPAPDQADPDLPPGTARLYLNLGRKDGAGTDQIRDLLRDQVGVGEVPSIDVMNTHTYLNVPAEDADRICAALTGKQLGEREMVCERARPRRR